jgi:hypothetical protein
LATILTRSGSRSGRATGRLINTHGPSLGYLPSFDGLRGIFTLGVVTYHAKLLPFHGSPLYVDWFFVGSGFLITTLLLDEWKKSDAVNLRSFYTRRALRLFPAMYAMVVVFVLLMVIVQLFVPGLQERTEGWWVDALSTSVYSYNFAFAGLLTAGLLPDLASDHAPHAAQGHSAQRPAPDPRRGGPDRAVLLPAGPVPVDDRLVER